MRLNEKEQKAIIEAVKSLDPEAQIYLFGSRVDDSKKGGDIDLLIISDKISSFKQKSQIHWLIVEKLGEQKLDILFSHELSPNFLSLIMQESVKL